MYNRFVQSMTANAKVAKVLGSIPASSDTVESEGRQMKQCWKQYTKRQKIPLYKENNRFVHCVCIYEGYISKFPKEQIGVDYMYRYSKCIVNFCRELTYYGLRTRSFSVADFSSTPYPPVTQRENILKGSLTRVFRLPDFFMNQFPQAP